MVADKKKRRKNQRKRKPANTKSSENEPAGSTLSIVDDGTRKRPIANDSDTEEKPKRKKKKIKPVPEDDTNKKGKKSIRQMKREKFAQRQAESEAAAKDQHKSECLSYISQWKHDKQNWRFMKNKQMWLYRNKFSASLIPGESWPLLLEYFESTQGNIRKLLLEDAENVIKKLDEWTEKQGQHTNIDSEETLEDEEDSEKPDDTSYKRARDLIQCLQE